MANRYEFSVLHTTRIVKTNQNLEGFWELETTAWPHDHAVVPWLSLPTPTPPPLSTTARPHYDKAHNITRAGLQGRNYEGRGWAQCPSLIIGVLFLQNVYCNNVTYYTMFGGITTQRGGVPSLLVAPDTISDMARRGKSLLVMSNSLSSKTSRVFEGGCSLPTPSPPLPHIHS